MKVSRVLNGKQSNTSGMWIIDGHTFAVIQRNEEYCKQWFIACVARSCQKDSCVHELWLRDKGLHSEHRQYTLYPTRKQALDALTMALEIEK